MMKKDFTPLVSSVSKTHSAEPPVNAATKGVRLFLVHNTYSQKRKKELYRYHFSRFIFVFQLDCTFFGLSGRINEVNNIVLLKTFILNLQLLDQFKYRIYPPIERRSVTSRYHGSKISGSGI